MSKPNNRADGVRALTLDDMSPNCEIFINESIFDLGEISKGKRVVDIGCGYGATRKIVEAAGGEWVGVEPFEGGNHTVRGDAQNLPFEACSFDVVYMNAVLEHVPDPSKAFKEVARILKKDGIFIGYVAFMECFHEISYCHLSFKALENFSNQYGMRLKKISGGHKFGIDYHKRILYYPFSFKFTRLVRSNYIRSVFLLKSKLVYLAYLLVKKKTSIEAKRLSVLYYKIECLRQSVGYYYYIVKE